MAAQSRAFYVGAFVLTGVVLALTALIFLGISDWFARTNSYVTYFDASVQGLNVDADVKFRGVDVGKVTEISLAPDNILIEVVMELDPEFTVRDSLRAKLGLSGISGLRYVELNYVTADKVSEHPPLAFTPPYTYIPSYPGGFEEIEQSLREIYDSLIAFDTEGISYRTKTLLDAGTHTAMSADTVLASADSLLQDPVLTLWMRKMSNTVDRLDATIGQLNTQRYDRQLDEALVKLNNGATEFNDLFSYLGDEARDMRLGTRTDSLFTTLTGLVVQTQQLVTRSEFATVQTMNNLNATISEMNATLDQMNSLMMSLESYPSNIIYTAPPKKER